MDTDNSKSLIRLISNRGSMYAFLSRLFRKEVDPELLDRMSRMDLPSSLELTEIPEMSEGFRLLKSVLDYQNERTLADLAVEYAGIFLGAGASQNAAYPYESIYTSPLRLVMQDARDEVLKLYRENGLDRAKTFCEPEDHIAFELEFLSCLCQKTVSALQADDIASALDYLRKQEKMLKEHLINWVPFFSNDVERMAQGDFYLAIAKITNGFLSMEQELIGEIVSEMKE